MRAHPILTVGDLQALLATRPHDEPIAVAACPDVTGFINPILGCVGEVEGDHVVVLALAEETLGGEKNLVFRDDVGNVVRPV